MNTARTAVDAGELEIRFEGVDLPTECVAADGDVESVEMLRIRTGVEHFTCEKNHAGTRTVGRHPVA